ncbi:MAG: hypothetical protein K9L68_00325 [Spirochaetales bacterium]|nr:hypothetical protein [Spirochaetales bacterium]MCF7937022.1 hypothetical protein [Spirochaetales bacterium]
MALWVKILLFIIIIVIAAAVLFISINKRKTLRQQQQLAEELVSRAAVPSWLGNSTGSPENTAGFDQLPEPVQNYLLHVLPEDVPEISMARLRQRGFFRLGGSESDWKPLKAEQFFSVDPPAFIWKAVISAAPGMKAYVVDRYQNGFGELNAKIMGTFKVADTGNTPEMNEGELMRYLAEAVWLPVVYLPGGYVEWEAVGSNSARAVVQHKGNSASLMFYFNDKHEIERIHSDARYRSVEGAFKKESWTGYFSDYQEHGNMLVPVEGRVEWNLESGDLPYWKASISEFEYRR